MKFPFPFVFLIATRAPNSPVSTVTGPRAPRVVGSALGDDTSRNRCAPNILVEDFDGTLDELRRRGVEVREVINDEDDGYRLARIADLEGNDLNLYV